MAANKFATMLHRNTHKIGVILVYTLLEWTLIALLLLNAIFSFLIVKFASFFGLKPPCVLCSRLDHVFEPGTSYRALLCDDHVAEISSLGYCADHRRLAPAGDMCEDCKAASWVKRSDDGERDLRCSCCAGRLDEGFHSPHLMVKNPSWGFSEVPQDEDVEVEGDEEQVGGGDLVVGVREECKDRSFEILAPVLGGVCVEEERVVPVELIDSSTVADKLDASLVEVDDGDWPSEYQFVAPQSAMDVGNIAEEKEEENSSLEIIDEVIKECSVAPPMVVAEQCSPETQFIAASENETDKFAKESPFLAKEFEEMQDIEMGSIAVTEDLGEAQALDEDEKGMDAEGNCEISIGSEICDQEQIDQVAIDEPTLLAVEENETDTNDKNQVIEIEPMETVSEEPVEIVAKSARDLRIYPEMVEVEDERAPETPTYIEGIHSLHKRFMFERRESGTESIDGSVASEHEGVEPLTVEHLKSALKAERKALSVLYTELEEERSASAVAANQTMAMITRLQEEKAAMQMEALQYQRMMEEQSEYDQEALQLLNELMMKREKEKQELEKELEVYRKKVLLYEAKERRMAARGKGNERSRTSSASSSAEESDDISLEFNEGDDSSYGFTESNQNTPSDAALGSETDPETGKHLITLDESLAEFEEERLSILEQLKALEEKLFSMDAEEHFDSLDAIKHLSHENGDGLNGHHVSSHDDESGEINGFPDELKSNGKLHSEHRNIGYKGKRLLPLFDAIDMENENGTDGSPESLSKFAIEQKKLAIAEEIDNVHERLQALEADREFLKHCITSLKKGDKGMDLLQEILQHLRDLRSVELRVRNAGDALASLSA